ESPPERLGLMLGDAGVKVVLTVQKLGERLPSDWEQTVCLDVEWEKISQESESEPVSEADAENLVYVIYTSGSTGEPKGVAVRQRALVARTIAMLEVLELTSADRLLQFVSPSFDAFGEGLFTTLICGASLVTDKHAVNYSARDLLKMVESSAITTLESTVS